MHSTQPGEYRGMRALHSAVLHFISISSKQCYFKNSFFFSPPSCYYYAATDREQREARRCCMAQHAGVTGVTLGLMSSGRQSLLWHICHLNK